MLSKVFGKALLERAIKTFCQSLVAVLGVTQLGLFDVDWKAALSLAGLAALVSVLTSVSSFSAVIDAAKAPGVALVTAAPVLEPQDSGTGGEINSIPVQNVEVQEEGEPDEPADDTFDVNLEDKDEPQAV